MSKKIIIFTLITMIFSAVCFAEEPSLNELQKLAKNLEDKKTLLDKRESDLNAKQKKLELLEEELTKKETQITKMKQEVSGYLKEIKESEDKNLDTLAKFYSGAKPKSAAAIISKMELGKAVTLLQKINPRAAGKIFTALGKSDPEFAAKISERMTPKELQTLNLN